MKKTALKERKCKSCGALFEPKFNSLQVVCSVPCAINYGNEKKKKAFNKEHKAAKESLLTHKDYIQLLQKVVNTYVRMRDKEKGCVSCGVTLIGKKFDAGHFLPTTYQFLRFNEDNIHGQCVHCNQHKHGSQYE
jgi:hypothetical protein